MTHLLFFGIKIAFIVLVRRNDDRNTLYDFKPVTFKTRDLAGIVGHQAELTDSEVDKHLGTLAVIAQIRSETQREIRLHRIKTLFLFTVGVKLVFKADAAPEGFLRRGESRKRKEILHVRTN